MHPFLHLQLLSRYDRAFNLRPAIARAVTPGVRVLDAGCGVGLLSFWAAQAGAGEIVAVDNAGLDLARALAKANGLGETMKLVHADLRALELPGRDFDVILAMIYLNDPRRDEAQTEIAFALRDRFLAANGRMLPDRVRYSVRVADWPAQDLPTRRAQRAAELRQLEQRYGFTFAPLAEAVDATPWPADFPTRGRDGRLDLAHARLISEPAPFAEIDYTRDPAPYPETFEITANAPGILNTIVWTQELWFEDLLLFSNESVSWIENPRRVDPGDLYRVHLGPHWRRRNCVGIS